MRSSAGEDSNKSCPAWPQNWSPAKQKELLSSMQAHTAAEVMVQLLLHGSHKWTYRSSQPLHPRPTNTMLLHADDRQPASAGAADKDRVEALAEPRETLEASLDDILEEEVEAEEARAVDVCAASNAAAGYWKYELWRCIQSDRKDGRVLYAAEKRGQCRWLSRQQWPSGRWSRRLHRWRAWPLRIS